RRQARSRVLAFLPRANAGPRGVRRTRDILEARSADSFTRTDAGEVWATGDFRASAITDSLVRDAWAPPQGTVATIGRGGCERGRGREAPAGEWDGLAPPIARSGMPGSEASDRPARPDQSPAW